MYHHCAFAVVQVATEPVTKTIEGCVLAATLAEGGIIRAMKVTHTHAHTTSSEAQAVELACCGAHPD